VVAISRNLIRATATALLLAAGVFASPGRATADCGDYVTIAGQPSAHHAMPAPGDAPQGETPRKPCNGPNCSKKQDPPVAPVRAPAPPTGDTKPVATNHGADTLPTADRGGWVTTSDSAKPIFTSTSVFHPPRSV
jgi:hypothetical protein